jgi:transketolase
MNNYSRKPLMNIRQSCLTIPELERMSISYRKTLLSIIKKANAGHTGGDLSCIDIINVLYNRILNLSPDTFKDPTRDRYIQSKGHSVEALYTVLCDLGFFSKEELGTLNKFRSEFIGHPTRKVNGIEHNTGALGHGLSISVGIALAGKLDGLPYRVFTLVGDGELEEGSNWEASMCAAQYELDNLVVIVDRNTLQITGRTEEVSQLESLEEKFQAFGYSVRFVDGNNIDELVKIFEQVPFEKRKPSLILANTVKGKGISFIEDQTRWHHRVPTDDEFALAMKELKFAEKLWQVQNGNG